VNNEKQGKLSETVPLMMQICQLEFFERHKKHKKE